MHSCVTRVTDEPMGEHVGEPETARGTTKFSTAVLQLYYAKFTPELDA